jgi:hypothetical protein
VRAAAVRAAAALARLKWQYAFVFLVVLSLAVGGFAILFSVHYYGAGQASQQRQAAQQQAEQRAQAQAFEHRLCTSFGQLAALQPPGGSPLDNPSRAYLQQQHDVLTGIGKDVGC